MSDEMGTCACPCGCEVPLSGGTCVDCGNGDHQNNNEVGTCDTCGQDKDPFSKENEYDQCAPCSVIDVAITFGDED